MGTRTLKEVFLECKDPECDGTFHEKETTKGTALTQCPMIKKNCLLDELDLARFTFENFDADFNDAHKDIAEIKKFYLNPKTKHRILFLFGRTGVGKTFLSRALLYEAVKRGSLSVFVISEEQFKNASTKRFDDDDPEGKNEAKLMLARAARVKLLLFDELGFTPPSKFAKAALKELLEDRYKHGDKYTIYTTNKSLEQIESDEMYGAIVGSRLYHDAKQIALAGKDWRKSK